MVPGCLRVGHPAGDGEKKGKRAELPSSLSLCHPFSFLAPSFAPAAASSILLSFASCISQRGFISSDSRKPIISSPPTSISSQPLSNNTQLLDQSPERVGSMIDAYQRIHCC